MRVGEDLHIDASSTAVKTAGEAVLPSVVMVDASCFSLPYDYSLCEALKERGCPVTLVRSELVHTPWATPSFAVKYIFTAQQRSPDSRRIVKMGKLAEHASDMGDWWKHAKGRSPASSIFSGCRCR